MKRIFIFLMLGASLSSSLSAMQNDKPKVHPDWPKAYPLNLITVLNTDRETIYRHKVEHTLVNDTLRPKGWGSPLRNKYGYFVDAQIDSAYTGLYHHHVYVNFEVKHVEKGKISCLHKVQKHFFHIPIGYGLQNETKIQTADLGPLNLIVAVSSFEDDVDSSDDDRD